MGSAKARGPVYGWMTDRMIKKLIFCLLFCFGCDNISTLSKDNVLM